MNTDNIRKIRDKICTGCASYKLALEFECTCNIPHKKDGHVCPCSECLIKGVCEDVCETVLKYKGDTDADERITGSNRQKR